MQPGSERHPLFNMWRKGYRGDVTVVSRIEVLEPLKLRDVATSKGRKVTPGSWESGMDRLRTSQLSAPGERTGDAAQLGRMKSDSRRSSVFGPQW